MTGGTASRSTAALPALRVYRAGPGTYPGSWQSHCQVTLSEHLLPRDTQCPRWLPMVQPALSGTFLQRRTLHEPHMSVAVGDATRLKSERTSTALVSQSIGSAQEGVVAGAAADASGAVLWAGVAPARAAVTRPAATRSRVTVAFIVSFLQPMRRRFGL